MRGGSHGWRPVSGKDWVLPPPGAGGGARGRTSILSALPTCTRCFHFQELPSRARVLSIFQNSTGTADQRRSPEQKPDSGGGGGLRSKSPAPIFRRTVAADAEGSPRAHAFRFLCPIYLGSEKSGHLRSDDNGSLDHTSQGALESQLHASFSQQRCWASDSPRDCHAPVCSVTWALTQMPLTQRSFAEG